MNPFKVLRKILANQEEILRQLSFERGVREIRDHGAELPGEAAAYWHGNWSIGKVRLGDLYYNSASGPCPFSACALYRFLATGDTREFEAFHRDMRAATRGAPPRHEGDADPNVLRELAERLRETGYDIAKCAIVVLSPDNVVIDGNHRTSALLAQFGPDHEIPVVRLYTPAYGPWGIVKEAGK